MEAIRRRVVLTEDDAEEIYDHKLTLQRSVANGHNNESRLRGQSAVISRQFHVSPKTIRDIWNRKTWTFATHHLWTIEDTEIITAKRKLHTCLYGQEVIGCQKTAEYPNMQYALKNRPGRPKGSRDSKPRRRKADSLKDGQALQVRRFKPSYAQFPADAETYASPADAFTPPLPPPCPPPFPFEPEPPFLKDEEDPFRADWPFW